MSNDASLSDRQSHSGIHSVKGFDFQGAYALNLLVRYLPEPTFKMLLLEGAEDVEARFKSKDGVQRHAIQVKAYHVALPVLREIVHRFVELDQSSPGTWVRFVVACRGFLGEAHVIVNKVKRYQDAYCFYSPDQDQILANVRSELEQRDSGLPIGFILERVEFDDGLPDLATANEWIRPRVISALQENHPEMTYQAAENAYLRLFELVSSTTGKPITRGQARKAITKAIKEHPLSPLPDIPRRALDLTPLLEHDLSEAGRCFLELTTDPKHSAPRIQKYIQTSWKKAPSELQRAVSLVRVPRATDQLIQRVEETGVSENIAALEWAYKTLDEDWQIRIADLVESLNSAGQAISGYLIEEIVQQRPWRAVLQTWPHLSLWSERAPLVGPNVEKGIRLLNLERNPFGSPEAETDVLLLRRRVSSPRLREIETLRPTIVYGPDGVGKTATALLLVYDQLINRQAFPIYYPTAPDVAIPRAHLDGIVEVFAQTLLCYLAAKPAAFLKLRKTSSQASIARLLAYRIGTGKGLALRFHQAGLPKVGDGRAMLDVIDSFTGEITPVTPLRDKELFDLISKARPYGFEHLLVLVDVRSPEPEDGCASPEAYLKSVLDLAAPLARVGVYLKLFLPDSLSHYLDRIEQIETIQLEWGEAELETLLKSSLRTVEVETLAVWCDPGARFTSPDQRLVRAAGGKPGQLIRLGNRLLEQLAGHPDRPLITANDLADVLGPPP